MLFINTLVLFLTVRSSPLEMKVEGALGSMASKIVRPCTRLLRVFKLRLKKPLFISSLRLRFKPKESSSSVLSTRKPRILSLPGLLRLLRRPKKIKARAGMLSCVSDERQMLFPSPLTPAFMRAAKGGTEEGAVAEEVEDACRSFENYLVEMIIEEGKARDIMEVEELLHCWKNLHSPVLIDLVCTFYGELCRDLFSSQNEDNKP